MHLLALLAVLVVAGGISLPRPALALDAADVGNGASQLDLAPYLAFLQTDQRDIPIERPDSHTQIRDTMPLSASGPGPTFRWVAAGLKNSAATPRDVVITVPFQTFAGSRLYPPRLAGSRVVSVTTAGAIKIEMLTAVGENAFAFTLPPGASGAIAFELNATATPEAILWQREAFDGRKDYQAFFRGAVLGVSLLLAFAMFALYGFRSRSVFPVAGGFALASLAFMVLEAGHLPPFIDMLAVNGLNIQVARAIIEGSMAAFLILLLATLSELPRLSRLAGNLVMVLGALAFAVPIYGFAQPLLATAIARSLFAVTAVTGFILIFMLWRREEAKAETALLSWSAVLAWTFYAAFALMAIDPGPIMSGVLLAGLAAVLVILGFTLAHYAFSQGYLSRHYFREAGRHALALAGARAYVWDWQPEEGELYISPEIERALALEPDLFSDVAGEAFLELMHPSDRSAYLAAIEESGYDGRTPIEKDFRLRHGEGAWRWFHLKARAITGHGQRAVRCIGTLTDITADKLAEERLLQDAVYDVVTRLPNRALFVDRLERALEAEPASTGLFVLLVDLDRFKMVNEAIGHEVGDALLAVVGRRLRTETEAVDSVARLPGDKFAILFHEVAGGRDVAQFAEAMVKAVARPITLEGQEFFLTACVGIAGRRADAAPAEQMMKEAAIALYEAKRRGSETVELFNPAMQDERAELVVLESELRRAIERNEIEVHYQPIASLADMNLAGFEALVRWRHPNLGLLAPESFIGLAEETGMIRDIGRVVLNEAGRQLGIWQRAYRPAEPVFVAVNISSAQLISPELVEDVKQILHRENLQRGTFKLEVTESLVMQYPERAQQILERFRELGIGLSCDDFGTGYSSLSSLRKLPFDTLKVDRSFIAADAQDNRAEVILESIIAMGHALGLFIVAEGVESQDQVDRLGELACDFGQGYFIGRPLMAKQVSEALAGLPYASAQGRTAITWLWERAQKDPPPAPTRRRITAAEIEEQRGLAQSAQRKQAQAPLPPASVRPRPEPPPAPEELPPPEPPAGEDDADFEDEVMESAEDVSGDDDAPPPAPRRKLRARRTPVLDDPDGA